MNYGNLHRASKYISKKFGGNPKVIYSRGRALAHSYRAGEFAELVDHVADVASRNSPIRLLDNEELLWAGWVYGAAPVYDIRVSHRDYTYQPVVERLYREVAGKTSSMAGHIRYIRLTVDDRRALADFEETFGSFEAAWCEFCNDVNYWRDEINLILKVLGAPQW